MDDPPRSKYWMDLDTFRKLLRTEAGLRVSILGDDIAPYVKQESDWRLGLYRDWLWTLEKGIGKNPIVPTKRRSEPQAKERANGARRQPKARSPTRSSRPRVSPRREEVSQAPPPRAARKTRPPARKGRTRRD